ncbi:hypothetical protein OUZ56_016182 [Daphnia magna]|uniref:Uncharacterized protein n=1 Tax=Daphnia magna TaxID=35525 RepID=A0ABR0AQ27_9CRUS|nr:hypothetical protein OUZ56_016182 [Daphnia magna]
MLLSGIVRTTAVEEAIKKQKLVSPMPAKSPKLKWMAIGGFVVGFMAVLKYTGNLNKAFFIDWFKEIPTDVKQRAGGGMAESPSDVRLPPGSRNN